MKKITRILLCAVALTVASVSPAQTNPVPNSTSGSLRDIVSPSPLTSAIEQDLKSIAAATNWVIAPYFTYGISGTAKGHIGGGLLVGYDFTENVGAFVAGDYLPGAFSLFSGQLQLKLPLHPIAAQPNFVVEPNVFTGIGFSGEIVAGGGVNLGLGHLWGGSVGIGLEAENISNSKADGLRGNVFASWRYGF